MYVVETWGMFPPLYSTTVCGVFVQGFVQGVFGHDARCNARPCILYPGGTGDSPIESMVTRGFQRLFDLRDNEDDEDDEDEVVR